MPDGQVWHFFEPEAVVRDGRPGWTFDAPADIDAILSHRFGRVLRKWARAADDGERAGVLLECAWFLLARNYQVDQSEFEAILALGAAWDEARWSAFWGEVLVLIGVAAARATGLAEVS